MLTHLFSAMKNGKAHDLVLAGKTGTS